MVAYLNTGRKIAGLALALAAGMALAQEPLTEEETGNGFLNGVVKLEVVTSKASIVNPWQNETGGGDGSGVVIGDGRILTCAHCVADSTFIRIRKHNEDSIYKGHVEFIDNDCDLALVTVKNLRHLVELLDNCRDEFVRIGADDGDDWDFSIVVETAKMREALPRVLKTYNIPADRSTDLK